MEQFKRNANGVLIGTLANITRVAAFMYEVPSVSGRMTKNGSSGLVGVIQNLRSKSNEPREAFSEPIKYLVYVERLSPPVARCQCENYLVEGKVCKHGRSAIEVAAAFRDLDPQQYQDELAERRGRRGL